MYEKVEKPKENKSKAVANTVDNKENNTKIGFGFVDNSLRAVKQTKIANLMNRSSQTKIVQLVQKIKYDPVLEYTNRPKSKSVLYGLEDMRQATKKRIKNKPKNRITIDEYNLDLGINDVMSCYSSALGIFLIREALESPGWKLKPQIVGTDPNIDAWISMLKENKHSIGLYDLGNKQSASWWFFGDTYGTKKIKDKNRLGKNAKPKDKNQSLEAKRINDWLGKERVTDRERSNMLKKDYNRLMALSNWIYKAFFRRTSKLGIDFIIDKLEARIHFNIAGRAPNATGVTDDGIAVSSNIPSESDRAITVSEYRHLKKKTKYYSKEKCNKHVNIYSEQPITKPKNH